MPQTAFPINLCGSRSAVSNYGADPHKFLNMSDGCPNRRTATLPIRAPTGASHATVCPVPQLVRRAEPHDAARQYRRLHTGRGIAAASPRLAAHNKTAEPGNLHRLDARQAGLPGDHLSQMGSRHRLLEPESSATRRKYHTAAQYHDDTARRKKAATPDPRSQAEVHFGRLPVFARRFAAIPFQPGAGHGLRIWSPSRFGALRRAVLRRLSDPFKRRDAIPTTHAAVGCAVTRKWTLCLRSWFKTMKDHEKPERGGRQDEEIDRSKSLRMVVRCRVVVRNGRRRDG